MFFVSNVPLPILQRAIRLRFNWTQRVRVVKVDIQIDTWVRNNTKVEEVNLTRESTDETKYSWVN